METTTVNALPCAPLAEKSVLSVIIKQPKFLGRASAEGIDSETFHIPAHRTIFEFLKTYIPTGPRIDDGELELVSLVESLNATGKLQRVGGGAGVYDIAGFALSPAGWSGWTDILREQKARRIALSGARKIDEAVDSEEAMSEVKRTLADMQKAVAGKIRAISAKQAADDFIRRYMENHKAGEIPGVSTGIFEIDAITGGMKAGELWVIGGKSSAGKSVLMMQIASEFMGEGKPVAIFSLELMAHEITGRMVTLTARVPYTTITQPRTAKKHELEKIENAIGRIKETRLWIDGSAGQTLDTIATEAERIRDIEGSMSLIVVDYLQICGVDKVRNEMREREIARISGGLKQLAKHLACPVLTGSQLNENNQTRESRAIEQDADTMILIEQDGLKMAKVRNGKRNDLIPLCLDGDSQRFRRFDPNQP